MNPKINSFIKEMQNINENENENNKENKILKKNIIILN